MTTNVVDQSTGATNWSTINFYLFVQKPIFSLDRYSGRIAERLLERPRYRMEDKLVERQLDLQKGRVTGKKVEILVHP